MLLFVLIVAVFTAWDQVQGIAAPTPPTKTTCNPIRPRDCADIKDLGFKESGVYQVFLGEEQHLKQANVYCDFDTPGGPWLVFQRRKDGSVDFARKWNDYVRGFGSPDGEFWLGNEILHLLTSTRAYKLRIDVEDFENQKRFVEYAIVSVGPATNWYQLSLGVYSGDGGNTMQMHNGQPFSTVDVDHNKDGHGQCAKLYRGGWWYGSGSCHQANLNGLYLHGAHSSFADGIEWQPWHGYNYSLKKTEMKIAAVI